MRKEAKEDCQDFIVPEEIAIEMCDMIVVTGSNNEETGSIQELTLLFGLKENTISECMLRLLRRSCFISLIARKTAASTWFTDKI